MNKQSLLSRTFLVLALGAFSTVLHAQDTWTQRASLGTAGRDIPVAFSIDGKAYAGMGYTGSVYLSDFWEYDPATDVWTQKASFSGGLRGTAIGFSIGGKGYAGTGYGAGVYHNDFWMYDPALNLWVQKAAFGGAVRGGAAAFSLGGKGYVGTGSNTTGQKKDFWEYNPVTDTWTQKSDFGGTVRSSAAAFALNGKGYIGLGTQAGVGYQSDFWEYNPANDSWTQKANYSGGIRMSPIGFSIGNKGYVMSGNDVNNQPTNDVWQYNPVADSWVQKANFPGTGRIFTASFTTADELAYICAGLSSSTFKNDVWEYDPNVIRLKHFTSWRYCAGDSIWLKYILHSGTNVQLSFQLSDASGSFSSAQTIGTKTISANTDSVKVLIPRSAAAGVSYRIRIVSSSDTSNTGDVFIIAAVPAKPTVTVAGNVFTSSAVSGNQWYQSSGMLSGEVNQTYVASQPGQYYTIVTSGGCASLPSDMKAFPISSLQDAAGISGMQLYPNPNRGNFILRLYETESVKIRILNLSGMIVIEKTYPATEEIMFRKGDIPAGCYILEATAGSALKRLRLMVTE